MGIECTWHLLTLDRLVDELVSGAIDIAAGFICRTPKRTMRTVFVPLDLPVELGIQAITRADQSEIQGRPFSSRKLWLDERARNGDLKIVIVEHELAWDYRHSLFDPGTPIQVERGGDIHDAVARYYNDRKAVIVTDHVTAANVSRASKDADETEPFGGLFEYKIGSFSGGFLLPASDREFLKFFRSSYQHLITSRMPVFGEIISKYADHMAPFMENRFRRLTLAEGNYSVQEALQPLKSEQPLALANWLANHWPKDIPVPNRWAPILADENSTAGKLLMASEKD
jgi:hypothetical protein